MSIFAISGLKGQDELRRALRKIAPQVLAEMEKAALQEANTLMGAANAGVPRRSGTLASSSVVTNHTSKAKTRAVAAYTDKKAAAVHEDIFWGRKSEKRQAGFKWFERAVQASVAGITSRILARLRALVSK